MSSDKPTVPDPDHPETLLKAYPLSVLDEPWAQTDVPSVVQPPEKVPVEATFSMPAQGADRSPLLPSGVVAEEVRAAERRCLAAHSEGVSAWMHGQPVEANPYVVDSAPWDLWGAGYRDTQAFWESEGTVAALEAGLAGLRAASPAVPMEGREADRPRLAARAFREADESSRRIGRDAVIEAARALARAVEEDRRG